MYVIERRLIPPGIGIRSPKKYAVLNPKGMCWHWTANPKKGAGAENHYRYWQTATEGAPYVVDDEKILQVAPDTEVIWHAGGGPTTSYAKAKYPSGTNSSLIGVEMCVNTDGDWNETYKRAVYLGAVKCIEYGWDPYKNFERHYDCTGKDCPRFWTRFIPGGDQVWEDFKADVAAEMKRMKGEVQVEEWKTKIMQDAADAGLIALSHGHQPDEPATKWFVLAVGLNVLKAVKLWSKK